MILEGPAHIDGIERISSITLSPSSHHFIVLSLLHRWLAEIAVSHARGVLLDFGCGGQPYRQLFLPHISTYVGADVSQASGVTLDIRLVPGGPVPLPDRSVDTILSTQVLEHVFDFTSYLAECHRLLRRGGKLIITVPQQWRLHEVPFDYWRFTRYGLSEVLSRGGFLVETMTPCGGVFALIGQILASHLSEGRRPSKELLTTLNRLALWLDARAPDYQDTLLWMCVARSATG